MKFRFVFQPFFLFVVIFAWAAFFLPAEGLADAYFMRLTPSGIKQRSAVLNGQFMPAQPGQAEKPRLRLLPAITSPKSANDFKQWLIIRADQTTAKTYFNALQQEGLADLMEVVGAFRISEFPNDTLVGRQWYLNRIRAPEAWQVTRGSDQIIIGVIDTGIDYTHPDLIESLWHNQAELNGLPGVDDDHNGYVDDVAGWDFTDAPRFADGGDYKDPDNDPMDEFGSGHGTQVAGIIAAQANNVTGISGIAPGVKVMNLRAGTASGYLEEDDVARAILYAVENGAQIINMSFGDVALSRFLKDVIYFAYQNGVLMICSSGNSGDDQLQYPSGLAETVSVGATDSSDYLAGFSSYGETLDLVAPGMNMLSTAVGGGYNRVNGTSFSAPVVSAIAGLVLSVHPGFSPERVRNILKTTSQDILYNGWDIYSGAGRADAWQAVRVPEAGILSLTQPGLNSGFAGDTLWLVGSIMHPDLVDAYVEYGLGKNPQQWFLVRRFEREQVFSDTLGFVSASQLSDTLITVRLTMHLVDARSDELRRIVFIDRTPPQITEVSVLPLYDGAVQSNLISFRSDDVCRARLFLRKEGSTDFDQVIDFNYETNLQRLKLDGRVYSGRYQFYLEAENYSGLKTVDDASGQYYSVRFENPFEWQEYQKTGYQLPSGYFMPKMTDLDGNGKKEITISRYTEEGNFGPVEIYEFDGGGFVQRLGTEFPAIPRDAGDYDRDGHSEILLGYGNRAFLFRALDEKSFPTQLVWQDTSDFWAAALADIDGDGKEEIIGRRGQEYQILEDQGGFNFKVVADLPNTTTGEQKYGIPTVLVVDFTGDGIPEIVYGDSDGDVLVFSGSNPADMQLMDTFRTAQEDATALLTSLTLSGQRMLFVASHSPEDLDFEHEFDGRYWSIERYVYNDALQRFEVMNQINLFGYHGLKDFNSGLSAASLNGQPYLFAAMYPQLYLFKINADQLIPVALFDQVNSNAVLAGDLDSDGYDEFYFNSSENIVSFTGEQENRPAAVHQFSARPLNEHRVLLNWQAPFPDAIFRIYRGEKPEKLMYWKSLRENVFIDSLLQNETTYYYAVSAVDSAYAIPESKLSPMDSAHTSVPPRLIQVKVLNDRQLELTFNEPILFMEHFPVKIKRSSDGLLAASHMILKNQEQVLCGFDTPFTVQKNDTVTVLNVFDAYGVPIDAENKSLPFKYLKTDAQPYLARVEILNRYRIRIFFNEPMDSASVMNLNHYRLIPAGRVLEIVPQDSAFRVVELLISKQSLVGGYGQATYLELQDLKNQKGSMLIETQRFNLFEFTSDLNHLVIYPQPVRPEHREIIFAQIPSGAHIRIFNLAGKPIKYLSQSSFGGIRWDLTDSAGRNVATGIYFYEITYNNDHKIGKVMIVR